MTVDETNPYKPPGGEAAAVRPPGPSAAVIAILWIVALVLLAAKLYGYVFVAAPDLLRAFVAVALAVALADRMQRRTGLWTIWSYILPPVALVLSQLRPPGSPKKPKWPVVLHISIAVVLAMVVFVAATFIARSTAVQDAMGELQAYLLVTCGYYTDYAQGSLHYNENVAVRLVIDSLADLRNILFFGMLSAAFLYRMGPRVIGVMFVAALLIGVGGDILGSLLFNIVELQRIELRGGSMMPVDLPLWKSIVGNPNVHYLMQGALVYGVAANMAWKFACKEYPQPTPTDSPAS